MKINELFNGIAVIIDDEIEDKDSKIYAVKGMIENENIPVATFSEVPNLSVISAFTNASFIILDWDFSKKEIEPSDDVFVSSFPLGDTLIETREKELISFVKQLVRELFVPVFIFTAKNPATVSEKLKSEQIITSGKTGRIFIKQKDEISSKQILFDSIEKWVNDMPSVYVLKRWESEFSNAKNNVFNAFYGLSPRWAGIVWDIVKRDVVEYEQEFGEFITRNIANKVKFSFDDDLIKLSHKHNVSKKELQRVVEGERFLAYDKETQPEQAYTGDLFKEKPGCYLLNIRAQCSLARNMERCEYNPRLYCIKGKPIKLDKMKKEKIDYSYGTLVCHANKAVIGSIVGELMLLFDLDDLSVINFADLKKYRIGRVLPPYITQIQQRFTMYSVREGTIPLPDELYT